MIFDGDERVLQIRRDRRNRHVVPLLIETKPAAAVGGMKPRVADAARQPIDRVALLGEPAERNRGGDDECVEQVLRPAEIGTPLRSIVSIVPQTLLRYRRAVGSAAAARSDRRDRADAVAADPALPRGQGAPAGASVGGDAEPGGDGVLGSVLPGSRRRSPRSGFRGRLRARRSAWRRACCSASSGWLITRWEADAARLALHAEQLAGVGRHADRLRAGDLWTVSNDRGRAGRSIRRRACNRVWRSGVARRGRDGDRLLPRIQRRLAVANSPLAAPRAARDLRFFDKNVKLGPWPAGNGSIVTAPVRRKPPGSIRHSCSSPLRSWSAGHRGGGAAIRHVRRPRRRRHLP